MDPSAGADGLTQGIYQGHAPALSEKPGAFLASATIQGTSPKREDDDIVAGATVVVREIRCIFQYADTGTFQQTRSGLDHGNDRD